jgi:hypothetical protein
MPGSTPLGAVGVTVEVACYIDGASGPYGDIAVGEGAVWVADCGSKLIYKADPNTLAVVKDMSADSYGCEGSIGVGEGAIWVVTAEGGDRTPTRFDAESGTMRAEISLPAGGGGVVAGYGSVWVIAGT